MSYTVTWTKAAKKQLDDLPPRQRLYIVGWVNNHLVGCGNPKAVEGGRRLEGTDNGWRFRVGSYRILASIIDEELVIEIVRVGHRQGVYSNMPKI